MPPRPSRRCCSLVITPPHSKYSEAERAAKTFAQVLATQYLLRRALTPDLIHTLTLAHTLTRTLTLGAGEAARARGAVCRPDRPEGEEEEEEQPLPYPHPNPHPNP